MIGLDDIGPSENIRFLGWLRRREGLEHGVERADEARVARDFLGLSTSRVLVYPDIFLG